MNHQSVADAFFPTLLRVFDCFAFGLQSVKKGLSGVGSVVPFPIMSKEPPPPYDGLEAQGLVDMGP